ncbi:hypothetical protein B6U83_02695 [Thermoplasmatales archaeon ex4484_36]|nr:MAG: hypothetical protein B6U83_02695 [Thermoplasmatales archaeon ex4484_36]RLF70924.1 MAG: hypothetical protein DRN40_03600 [Thermoplasmata archaeon]
MEALVLLFAAFAFIFFAFFAARVIWKYLKFKEDVKNSAEQRAKRLPARGGEIGEGLNIVHFASRGTQLQNYRHLLLSGGLYFTPLPEKRLKRYLPGVRAREVLIVKDSPRRYSQKAFKITDLSGILQEILDWWEEGGRGAVVIDSFENIVLENEPERVLSFLNHLKEYTEKEEGTVLVSVNTETLSGKRKKLFTEKAKVTEIL